MAYFSGLVLVCLACFAKDVIELEPVKALSFHCDRLSPPNNADQATIAIAQGVCQANAYCRWNSPKCDDDACLIKSARVLTSTTDTCDAASIPETCAARDLTNIANAPSYVPSLIAADCANATVNTGILCATNTPGYELKVWDYCAYAYIRDQACPPSICETNAVAVGCVRKTSPQQCQSLSENDCKNVPKCLWNSTNCEQDPCFSGSEQQNCANWFPQTVQPLVAGDCIDFKPLKSGSSNIANYCVYKTNTNPNICYFAPTGNNVTNTGTDYGTDWELTYPTYDFITTPTFSCSGQLAGCEGTGECYTTLNQRGALAGLYCTDGTHGAASVLRIPSVLLFLAVCALSMFVV